MTEMPIQYDPKYYEDMIYTRWMDAGIFGSSPTGIPVEELPESSKHNRSLVTIGNRELAVIGSPLQQKQFSEDDKRIPEILYFKALHVMKGRWLEAEEFIKKDPEYAYLYAKNVIKGKWPEAEEYIIKDLWCYTKYINDVISYELVELYWQNIFAIMESPNET